MASEPPESAVPEAEIVAQDDGSGLQPALERLPPDERAAIVELVETQVSHSGPLPPPGLLRHYDEVLPGLAERIVRLTEREQEFRHEVVGTTMSRNSRLKERGQGLGMVALVLMLAFCALLVKTGNAKIAGAVAVGLIAAVVGIFVIGKRADASAADSETVS